MEDNQLLKYHLKSFYIKSLQFWRQQKFHFLFKDIQYQFLNYVQLFFILIQLLLKGFILKIQFFFIYDLIFF